MCRFSGSNQESFGSEGQKTWTASIWEHPGFFLLRFFLYFPIFSFSLLHTWIGEWVLLHVSHHCLLLVCLDATLDWELCSALWARSSHKTKTVAFSGMLNKILSKLKKHIKCFFPLWKQFGNLDSIISNIQQHLFLWLFPHEQNRLPSCFGSCKHQHTEFLFQANNLYRSWVFAPNKPDLLWYWSPLPHWADRWWYP